MGCRAADVLGNAVAAGGDDSARALRALVDAFGSDRERTRRAATYGLAISGARAVPDLACAVQAPLSIINDFRAGGVGGPAGAAYALGGCVAGAEIDDIEKAATALMQAIDGALATLSLYEESRISDEAERAALEKHQQAVQQEAAAKRAAKGRVGSAEVAVDAVATEHRRLLASASRSLSILCNGALAVHTAEPVRQPPRCLVRLMLAIELTRVGCAQATAAIVGRAVRTLAALVVGEEPGVEQPSYLGPAAVKINATAALLRICSVRS